MVLVVASLLAFAASVVLTGAVVHWAGARPGRTGDSDFSGPQKFHSRVVPRVGGIGIFVGLWLAAMVLWWQQDSGLDSGLGFTALLLMACGSVAFGAGIAEDLTKRISPAQRLVATALGAALAVPLLGTLITRTDLPGLDWLVGFMPFGFALTVFAVAGVANSINLIDGFNGLASACVMIMLLGLAAVGWHLGDMLVLTMALCGVGAVLGFLLWNFPRGLIFLGDGGAYLLGFFLAQLALLLLVRNAQVSPLFPLALVIYPVFETLFTMYRRKVLKGRPMGQPDGAHLHSLIFRRFMRSDFANLDVEERTMRNSMTSPRLWMLCAASVAAAVWFWDNSAALLLCMLLFCAVYLLLYWRIVRFRSLRLRRLLRGH